MDIELIKAAYPNPMVCPDNFKGDATCYCVGGGIALYYDIPWLEGSERRFPHTDHLAEVLREANPLLTRHEALLYARLITRMNDTGQFWYAWNMADEAINYHPEEA
jgi:hypothetical protein